MSFVSLLVTCMVLFPSVLIYVTLLFDLFCVMYLIYISELYGLSSLVLTRLYYSFFFKLCIVKLMDFKSVYCEAIRKYQDEKNY